MLQIPRHDHGGSLDLLEICRKLQYPNIEYFYKNLDSNFHDHTLSSYSKQCMVSTLDKYIALLQDSYSSLVVKEAPNYRIQHNCTMVHPFVADADASV
jgi:hypothetical protein